ncbi:MAG: hypothetical protein U1E05_00450 [Patescibacteria group bacterium]|nr:hypothetical protein [Patescibacteria group bacterium]
MFTKTSEGHRLLEIDNVHTADCGLAPSLDTTDKYVGYFENLYGEQWVFVGDRDTGNAKLFGGDVGWETAHDVSLTRPCPDLILNEPERLWLLTCFMAMSDTSLSEIVATYNEAARRMGAEFERQLDEAPVPKGRP